ncbi:MAG: DUF3089 domain-containing protein [Deltaproteobacteria bacterium]|nr:DUF3089 domain-containing protein [Deltaproteobacteria bacterium]
MLHKIYTLVLVFCIGILVSVSMGAPAIAQTKDAADKIAAKIDYSEPSTWLCRPGRQDACIVDLSTTVVAADGSLTREDWAPNPDAPIDCFYIYPTVSLDPTPSSDMNVGPEEQRVVVSQLARFASQCRVYAPMYRQRTLTALRAEMAGKPMAPADVLAKIAKDDVLDAWNYYLKNDNKGRGIVLVGHSQGARMLIDLIRDEIDGKPAQSQIISAILIGANVMVARNKDVGGTFKHMPLCHKKDDTGCVIAYSSFRSTIPPPEKSRYGLNKGDLVAACANPAALEGGSGELHSYLQTAPSGLITTDKPFSWVTPPKPISTPFVSVPGLLKAKCVTDDRLSYLEVAVQADPKDPRTDDIIGDVIVGGKVLTDWGLHVIDMHLAMGNFLDIVNHQAKAYLKAKKK